MNTKREQGPNEEPEAPGSNGRALEEFMTGWLGLPSSGQATLGLVFIPMYHWSPWTALLFTAAVTWALTTGVLSLIRMLSDEAAAPLNVVSVHLALSSEAHGLRQELQELEQYYHAHNAPDLYYLVEECLHEVQKRWGCCLGGSVEVRSSTSYRLAQRMFEEGASHERARSKACLPDGPPFPWQQSEGTAAGGGAAAAGKWGGFFGFTGGAGASVHKRLGRVFAGRSGAPEGDGGTSDEVVVVTLMLLTTRSLDLPAEESHERVGAALQQLRGLTTGQILDAQLLWTPQQQGQYISQGSVTRHYDEIQGL